MTDCMVKCHRNEKKKLFHHSRFFENVISIEKEKVYSIKQATRKALNPQQQESIQNTYHTHNSLEEFLNAGNELEMCNTMTNEESVLSINAEIFDEEI